MNFRHVRRPEVAINLTLIDVVFLLLTGSSELTQLVVDLPEADVIHHVILERRLTMVSLQ